MMWNLAYWTFAYIWTILAVLVAFRAVGHVKAGKIQAHRRLMVGASNMMIFFVLTYVAKVLILGREDKSNWESFYLITLYIHEAFIGLMLVFGTLGRLTARHFGKDIDSQKLAKIDVKLRRQHKLRGKLTLYFAILAIITATVVLYGMYARA